jgi:hypothetical protein
VGLRGKGSPAEPPWTSRISQGRGASAAAAAEASKKSASVAGSFRAVADAKIWLPSAVGEKAKVASEERHGGARPTHREGDPRSRLEGDLSTDLAGFLEAHLPLAEEFAGVGAAARSVNALHHFSGKTGKAGIRSDEAAETRARITAPRSDLSAQVLASVAHALASILDLSGDASLCNRVAEHGSASELTSRLEGGLQSRCELMRNASIDLLSALQPSHAGLAIAVGDLLGLIQERQGTTKVKNSEALLRLAPVVERILRYGARPVFGGCLHDGSNQRAEGDEICSLVPVVRLCIALFLADDADEEICATVLCSEKEKITKKVTTGKTELKFPLRDYT